MRERPLLRFALAAWLGSLLGGSALASRASLLAACAATLVALAALPALVPALLAARERRARERTGRATTGARPLELARRARLGRGLATSILVVAATAARASGPDGARAEPAGTHGPAWAEIWLATRGFGRIEIGTWRPERALEPREVGRVDPSGTRLLVAAGSVREGELVARTGARPLPAWPRGPEPGPRARAAKSSGAGAADRARLDEGEGPELPESEPAGIEAGADRPPLAVSPDELVRLSARRPDLAAAALAEAREGLLARAARIEDPLARGLVCGLLFGDLASLPRGIGDLFVRTGTFHVLAVSGMQVALVAVWIAWPLGSALAWALAAASRGRVRPHAALVRALLLTLFVPLAGAEPPVVRAAIAYGLGSLAVLVPRRLAFARSASRAHHATRRLETTSAWALALALECLLHPRAAQSLSVALSYTATLALIHATAPCADRLRAFLPQGGRIDPVGPTGRTRAGWWVVPLQIAVDSVIAGTAGSLAAVLATLPFAWSHFGEWSPIGILATPLLLPPIAALLGGGALHLCLPAGVLDPLLAPVAHAMVLLLELSDLVPGSPVPLPPRPFALVALAVAASFTWLLARDPRTARTAARAAALLGIALCVPWRAAPRTLELWALEVGSGSALLLRAPVLGTWIFDAGSRDRPDVAREALAPLLRTLEVGELGIVLSHADRDHHGALPWIVERFPPRVWAGTLPRECEARLPSSTARLDLAVGRLRLAGAAFLPQALPEFVPGSLVEPRAELVLLRSGELAGNEGSRSLSVRWGPDRLLLCGDAEEDGLAAWLRSDPPESQLRLLLMPHHGSETDWLGTLLAHTAPREAWISSTRPPPVARELERRGIPWRWTERDGPLHLELPALDDPRRDAPATEEAP